MPDVIKVQYIPTIILCYNVTMLLNKPFLPTQRYNIHIPSEARNIKYAINRHPSPSPVKWDDCSPHQMVPLKPPDQIDPTCYALSRVDWDQL